MEAYLLDYKACRPNAAEIFNLASREDASWQVINNQWAEFTEAADSGPLSWCGEARIDLFLLLLKAHDSELAEAAPTACSADSK